MVAELVDFKLLAVITGSTRCWARLQYRRSSSSSLTWEWTLCPMTTRLETFCSATCPFELGRGSWCVGHGLHNDHPAAFASMGHLVATSILVPSPDDSPGSHLLSCLQGWLLLPRTNGARQVLEGIHGFADAIGCADHRLCGGSHIPTAHVQQSHWIMPPGCTLVSSRIEKCRFRLSPRPAWLGCSRQSEASRLGRCEVVGQLVGGE